MVSNAIWVGKLLVLGMECQANRPQTRHQKEQQLKIKLGANERLSAAGVHLLGSKKKKNVGVSRLRFRNE